MFGLVRKKKVRKIISDIVVITSIFDGEPIHNISFLNEGIRMTDEWDEYDETTQKAFEHGINFTMKYLIDKFK